MPPKPKYTREQIVETALNVVSKKGFEALTAKELGNALSTSTSPIFTFFSSMQEVQDEVKKLAMFKFEESAKKSIDGLPIFKRIGIRMVEFAKNEPQLYKLLFMSSKATVETFDDIYTLLGGLADECVSAIENDYALSEEYAKMLFEHTWVYTYGIGVLCATGICTFSDKQIGEMLTTQFDSIMLLIKEKRENLK